MITLLMEFYGDSRQNLKPVLNENVKYIWRLKEIDLFKTHKEY